MKYSSHVTHVLATEMLEVKMFEKPLPNSLVSFGFSLLRQLLVFQMVGSVSLGLRGSEAEPFLPLSLLTQ